MTAAELSLMCARHAAKAVREGHRNPGVNVVLQQAVEKLGLEGDVVNVSRGYARNFLVPNRLARLVPKIPEVSTPRSMLPPGALRTQEDFTSVQQLQKVLDLLANEPVELKRRCTRANWEEAGSEQTVVLRQSVTAGCISRAALAQHQIQLVPQLLSMEGPLNSLGLHRIPLRMATPEGVRPSVTVRVVAAGPKDRPAGPPAAPAFTGLADMNIMSGAA